MTNGVYICVDRLSSLTTPSEPGGAGTELRREVEGLDGLGGLSGQLVTARGQYYFSSFRSVLLVVLP